jgi:hypothetical protein
MPQPPTSHHDFGDKLLRQPGVTRIRHADPRGDGYVIVEHVPDAHRYLVYHSTARSLATPYSAAWPSVALTYAESSMGLNLPSPMWEIMP